MAILVRPGDKHRVTIIHDHPDGTRDVYTTDQVGVLDARVHQGSVDIGDEFFPDLLSTEFQISGGKFNHTRTKREIMQKKLSRELEKGDIVHNYGKVTAVSATVFVGGHATIGVAFEDRPPHVFRANDEIKIISSSTIKDSRGYCRKLEVKKAVNGKEGELYLRISDDFDNPTGIYIDREDLRLAIDNPKVFR